MKKTITRVLMALMLLGEISIQAQGNLFISEVLDPGDEYTGRYVELFNAGSEVIDLSATVIYLSRQSNGGTSWGEVQLAGMIAAGGTYVIGGSAFESIYGFAPDLVSGILTGNGDDPYYLFTGGDHSAGTLHDILGAPDTDGTGEPWEYTDSRALRIQGVDAPNSTWNAAEWEITSADVADGDPGVHHGAGGTLPPPGDHVLTLVSDTVDAGSSFELSVRVSDVALSDNVISYQFDIQYDPTVLSYLGYSMDATLSYGGTLEVNADNAGILRIGYMNTLPLDGAGEILRLQFDPLLMDLTQVSISSAFLNNIPVVNLHNASILISETAAPVADISYSDTLLRFADELLITAIFNEAMDPDVPLHLNMSGAVSYSGLEMSRLSDTEYRLQFTVPKASGEVAVSLSNGTDLWGNVVEAIPASGGYFSILKFTAGDVNDDGMVQAYDAALTLQYSVGLDPLPDEDPVPWESWRDSTANVSGYAGITAFDAGMILQYAAGIISDFPISRRKSLNPADVSVDTREGLVVFYSQSDLIGLNVEVVEGEKLLGDPMFLGEDLLSAKNIQGDTYRLGLCMAYPVSDGDPLLRIPVLGEGRLILQLMYNDREKTVDLDLSTSAGLRYAGNVLVYPNPAGESIAVSGLEEEFTARIYSMQGQLILEYRNMHPDQQLDISSLAIGMYILSLESEGEEIIRKFSVK